MKLFGPAVSLKLAADRKWERALVQRLGQDEADVGTRQRWLVSAGDDVAIEIGFETAAFVGLRLRPDERARAVSLVADLLGWLEGRGGGIQDVITAVEQTAPRFAGAIPVRAEVGILDRWQSMGSVDLGPPPWTGVDRTLTGHHLGKSFCTAALSAPLMLEVLYGAAADGWLAAPISAMRQSAVGVGSHHAEPATFDRVAATLASLTRLT